MGNMRNMRIGGMGTHGKGPRMGGTRLMVEVLIMYIVNLVNLYR